MKNTCLFAFFTCLFSQLLFAQSFEGYQKKALIIGNSNYEHYPNLPNTESDMLLLVNKMYAIGFEVTLIEDSKNIAEQVQQFYQNASDSTLFFVYYSGYIGAKDGQPALVSTASHPKEAALLTLQELVNMPKGKNSKDFLLLDWASLDIEKQTTDKQIETNWERWRGQPKDNFQIQDQVNRTFPKFTEQHVLAMYQKSFRRDYDYVEKFVEGIADESLPLQEVLNRLEFDIPRTQSILGGWGSNEVLTRSFFTGAPPSMPAFPFPPPKASAFHALPNGYFRDSMNLYEVNEHLTAALDACGYGERSYYQIPKGYAMVTRIEKINEDGTPCPLPERWDIDHPLDAQEPFSIVAFFRSLFQANIGTYRIIVFVITSEGVEESSDNMSMVAAEKYLSDGWKNLPKDFQKMDYTEDYNCTAFVYEFVKHEHEEGKLVEKSKHLGETHLQKSKFLSNLAYMSDK